MPIDYSNRKIPIYSNINDNPIAPTTTKGSNGSYIVNLYNNLLDEISYYFNQHEASIQSNANATADLEAELLLLNTRVQLLTQQLNNLTANPTPNTEDDEMANWIFKTENYTAKAREKVCYLGFTPPGAAPEPPVFTLPEDAQPGDQVNLILAIISQLPTQTRVRINIPTNMFEGININQNNINVFAVSNNKESHFIYISDEYGWTTNNTEALLIDQPTTA